MAYNVFYFPAFVKFYRADQAIIPALPKYGLFYGPRLGIGAIKNHKIVKIRGGVWFRGQYFFNFSGNKHTLLCFVSSLDNFYFLAAITAGPPFFFCFINVFLYNCACCVQNVLATAVI